MGSQKTFQDYIWQEKATKYTGVDDLERKKVYHVADLASSASSKVTASSADLGVVALLAVVTMAACSAATLTTISSSSNLFTISHTIILILTMTIVGLFLAAKMKMVIWGRREWVASQHLTSGTTSQRL